MRPGLRRASRASSGSSAGQAVVAAPVSTKSAATVMPATPNSQSAAKRRWWCRSRGNEPNDTVGDPVAHGSLLGVSGHCPGGADRRAGGHAAPASDWGARISFHDWTGRFAIRDPRDFDHAVVAGASDARQILAKHGRADAPSWSAKSALIFPSRYCLRVCMPLFSQWLNDRQAGMFASTLIAPLTRRACRQRKFSVWQNSILQSIFAIG